MFRDNLSLIFEYQESDDDYEYDDSYYDRLWSDGENFVSDTMRQFDIEAYFGAGYPWFQLWSEDMWESGHIEPVDVFKYALEDVSAYELDQWLIHHVPYDEQLLRWEPDHVQKYVQDYVRKVDTNQGRTDIMSRNDLKSVLESFEHRFHPTGHRWHSLAQYFKSAMDEDLDILDLDQMRDLNFDSCPKVLRDMHVYISGKFAICSDMNKIKAWFVQMGAVLDTKLSEDTECCVFGALGDVPNDVLQTAIELHDNTTVGRTPMYMVKERCRQELCAN